MRYLILKPRDNQTFDPRSFKCASMDQLHDLLPPVAECSSEREAIDTVRKMMPDCVGMPADLKIGSGSTILLCLVEDANVPIDPGSTLEFVLAVQPIAGDNTERKAIGRAVEGQVGLVFDKLAWAPKPQRPQMGRDIPIEWRTSELELPVFMEARAGYVDGKLVVYLELDNRSMSIKFQQAGLGISQQGQ